MDLRSMGIYLGVHGIGICTIENISIALQRWLSIVFRDVR